MICSYSMTNSICLINVYMIVSSSTEWESCIGVVDLVSINNGDFTMWYILSVEDAVIIMLKYIDGFGYKWSGKTIYLKSWQT